MTRKRYAPLLLTGVPAGFLLISFVVPNLFLFAGSFFHSEAQVMTTDLTLENYETIFHRQLYVAALVRTLWIAALSSLLVVGIAYPVAFFLTRTTSRWKDVLLAIALAPLLASVVVRTYGWWIVLNPDGALNELFRTLGLIDAPLRMLPSAGAIVVGLVHALLPFGIIAIVTSLNGINLNLERASMSLGANRLHTFLNVTLPLTMPGIIAGFVLAFGLSISAYATPQILGGAAVPTMSTQIYVLMTGILDWSLGSAMSVMLVLSAIITMGVGASIGARMNRSAGEAI